MEALNGIVQHYNQWMTVFLMVSGLYIVIARGNMIKTLVGLSLFQTSVYLLYLSPGKILGGITDGPVNPNVKMGKAVAVSGFTGRIPLDQQSIVHGKQAFQIGVEMNRFEIFLIPFKFGGQRKRVGSQ